MKKKLLIVLFAFVMVFSLAGCGSNDEVVNDGTDTTTTQEEKDMDDAGDSIKDGVEDTGDAIKNGADDVGDALRRNLHQRTVPQSRPVPEDVLPAFSEEIRCAVFFDRPHPHGKRFFRSG